MSDLIKKEETSVNIIVILISSIYCLIVDYSQPFSLAIAAASILFFAPNLLMISEI